MRWYFPGNMDAYRYIIISVNPWGDGNLIPQWGDQWMNGNSEAGNLVSQRILGGNVATDNTIIVLDRSLESFTPAYNGLQLLGENIAAGTDISYNYVCLSKNAFPPLFNTPEKPESSDPESSDPESSTPESSTPESSAPESSAPDVPMIPKTIELKFADATVADNVIAEAVGDGFKMYVDPDQTGIYKNIGDVRWNMKLDLGSLETLTVDAAENNTAFFMTILICNEYGDPVDSLAFPTYINGQPGKHTYNLAAAMAQKDAAYHEGEWNVIISLGIDDGGNKNALLYNTFNSLVIETNEMIPAPESSEGNKNEEKPGNPDTGVATALSLVMLAVAASGTLALTRKKQ